MSDPKRWSEDAEAGELERELLGAGQSVRLPESERRALWAGIALSLPAVTPTLAPSKALATSGLKAYFTKATVFLAAVGGLSVGVAQFWSTPAARAPIKTELAGAKTIALAPAVAPTPAPRASTPETLARPETVAAPSESKPRAPSESQLREESAAVLEARAALRSGDAARSLALLEQARVRFPHGGLGQEREALTIQALAQSGQRAAARRRGQAFLRAHPTSPYTADVRRITAE